MITIVLVLTAAATTITITATEVSDSVLIMLFFSAVRLRLHLDFLRSTVDMYRRECIAVICMSYCSAELKVMLNVCYCSVVGCIAAVDQHSNVAGV